MEWNSSFAMRKVTRACLAGAAALLAQAPVEAERFHGETIVVRLRHSFPICGGFCPHFQLRVGPTGRVLSRSLKQDGKTYRYRVSPRQLTNFRRILNSIRSRGHLRLEEACKRNVYQDRFWDEFDDPRPDDVEVSWIGPAWTDRLTSCGQFPLPAQWEVIMRALRALGADAQDGNRRGTRP